jgi:hypothetical protein
MITHFVPLVRQGLLLCFHKRASILNTLIPCPPRGALWMSVDETGGVLVFAILYGLFHKVVRFTGPNRYCIVSPSDSIHRVGTCLGCSSGFGIL